MDASHNNKIPWELKFMVEGSYYVCKACGKECNNLQAVRKHARTMHGLHVDLGRNDMIRAHAIWQRDSLALQLDSVLAERESALAERESAVAERESVLVELQVALAERERAVAERDRYVLLSKMEQRRKALSTVSYPVVTYLVDNAIQESLDLLGNIPKNKPHEQAAQLDRLYNWSHRRRESMPIKLNIMINLGGIQMSVPWCYIDNSTIEGAGNGLFAARSFAQGDLIGYYWGKPAKNNKSEFSRYQFLEVDAIGGLDNPLGLGLHFTNDPAFGVVNEDQRKLLFCKVNISFGRNYDAYALRAISPGEEILVDYNYNGSL